MAGACVSILASRWWQAAKPSGKDEAVDYNWLMEFKKTYSASKPVEQQSFISLSLEEETPKQSYPNKDSHINVMGKTYTLEDGEGLMAELKSTRGMVAEMRGRRRSALPLRLSKNLLTIKFTSK